MKLYTDKTYAFLSAGRHWRGEPPEDPEDGARCVHGVNIEERYCERCEFVEVDDDER